MHGRTDGRTHRPSHWDGRTNLKSSPAWFSTYVPYSRSIFKSYFLNEAHVPLFVIIPKGWMRSEREWETARGERQWGYEQTSSISSESKLIYILQNISRWLLVADLKSIVYLMNDHVAVIQSENKTESWEFVFIDAFFHNDDVLTCNIPSNHHMKIKEST